MWNEISILIYWWCNCDSPLLTNQQDLLKMCPTNWLTFVYHLTFINCRSTKESSCLHCNTYGCVQADVGVHQPETSSSSNSNEGVKGGELWGDRRNKNLRAKLLYYLGYLCYHTSASLTTNRLCTYQAICQHETRFRGERLNSQGFPAWWSIIRRSWGCRGSLGIDWRTG